LDNHITLLEFLFNNLELLGIRKSVFGFDNFFKVGPETHTLIHITLNLQLCLVGPSVLNVPFQKFDLVAFNLQFKVLVANFPFQINDEVVGICFAPTTEFKVSILGILLKLKQLINHLVFSR
jgi:hypothetical protein